ncbi:MAG: class I SAM-dependent methyltransferase [Candidatus Omnitrophica bacterium]|nr:class I SAM-dependent methyltransferase [Candidatus Omnitrophota bacterium]
MNRVRFTSFGFWAIVVLSLLVQPLMVEVTDPADQKRFPTSEEISHRYLPRHPIPRDEAEKKIVTAMDIMYFNQSRNMGNVPPEDGRLMRMLVEMLDAKYVVELGAANGYSAMWFCLALRSTGGKLTTHEIDPERISLAKKNFKRADVEDIVTLVEGDAHETIKNLTGPIDLVLLDAEKEGFTDYLTKLLPLVRIGGLIIAHDSSGHAHLMEEYFQAIVENPDLETSFVDASRWGMCITRKMR